MKMEVYNRRKALGLCVRCGMPTGNGKTRCEECIQYERASARKRYVKRAEAHRCRHCGRPLPEGRYYVVCELCKMKQKARYIEERGRLSNGQAV